MATTLQFTDGTTTVSLIDGASGYGLLYGEWSPRVATRRLSVMGGSSPYNDVQEEMRITIESTTTALVLTKLQTLSDLFDQANKWNQNDAGVTAVKLQYKHNDSSTTVSAVIFDAEVILPREFTAINHARGFKLGISADPIILRFTRRGLWLGATEVKAAAATTGNPAIQTIAAFTDTPKIPVPYDIDMEFSGPIGSTGGGIAEIYTLTANAADKLYMIECEAMTNGSSQAQALSSAGNVHRQADSGSVSLIDSSFDMNDNSRLYAFYVVVKPSAALTNWTIQATLSYSTVNAETTSASRPVIVGGSTSIQIVPLGLIATAWKPSKLTLAATPDAVNSETFDLDYICGIALDDSSNIIRIIPGGTTFSAVDEIKVTQQLLTKKTPTVTALISSVVHVHKQYEGNAYPYASGNSISALVFGIVPYTTSYVIYDYTAAGEADITFTATRTMGYLTPL